jgi:hypothetical protein
MAVTRYTSMVTIPLSDGCIPEASSPVLGESIDLVSGSKGADSEAR